MPRKAPIGAPAWLVTFADLMSLLVAFFVLIISFSVPDVQKLKIIAGSIRDAFGIAPDAKVTGYIELEGDPRYQFARDMVPFRLEDVVGPIPDHGEEISRLAAREEYWARALAEEEGESSGKDADSEEFERIEAELREAMRSLPELARLGDNLHMERTPEGLRIQLIDQARMSMFPLGSTRMYQPTRALLGEVARAIADLPNRILIAGHTDGLAYRRDSDYDNWSLSLDRADATRRVMVETGLDESRIAAVIGKADTEHMVPEAPTDPRNRRISITLLRRPDAAVVATGDEPAAAPGSE